MAEEVTNPERLRENDFTGGRVTPQYYGIVRRPERQAPRVARSHRENKKKKGGIRSNLPGEKCCGNNFL